MRTISLADCLNLDPGETIPQTRGVLKAVFDRKTGEKDGNPWSVQNCILAEGQNEIKLKAWNHNDLMPMKGRQVWLIANKNQKDGKLNGLTLIEEEYKGKTSKVIEARAKAEIVRADSPQPKPDDDDQIPGAEVPARPAPTQAASAPRPAAGNWKDAGGKIARLGNLYSACCAAVCNRVGPAVLAKSGYAMGPEHIQAATASLFIEFNRKFGLESIPETPFPLPTAPPKQPDPEPDPELDPDPEPDEDVPF